MGVHRPHLPALQKAALALLFIAFLVLAPALALPAADTPPSPAPATPGVWIGEGQGSGTGSPATAVTLRPTPLPTRQQNRTTLAQIAKNAADRQKVTIPAFWFLIIVGIAATGLLAILYLLIRHGSGVRPRRKAGPAPAGGKDTIIEPAEPAHHDAQEPRRAPGPAVEFPPSLARRFRNPVFIGEGGLARVFRAENARTGRTVAVKVPVRYDEVTGTHFTRDIVFWQGLLHENIIRIYSSNILPVPYIEMEYAPASLAALPLPLPEERAVCLVLGIARGLSYAHGRGVVHRDIKPENVLLTEDGTPKITDWGLGKAIGDSRQSTMIGFSPVYAAPEQIAPHRFGRPGEATDIYQTGMVLCELLTGRPAFRGEGIHDLNVAILEEAPVIPSWNGRHEPELRAVILTCLAKQPPERYPSVDDLIADLESILKS